MMKQKTQIKELLKNSALVSLETKAKILDNLETLSDDVADLLLTLLKNTTKTQDVLLGKVIRQHPDFLDFLEHYTSDRIRTIQHNTEEQNSIQEEEILKSLEIELDLN